MRAFTPAALAAAVALAAGPHAPAFDAVVLPRAVRDSMRARWEENNRHWDELSDVNTLTQMLGTGKPTQREYLGCLFGRVAGDTLWIEGAAAARRLRQLQFAVTGDCDAVQRFVGTWHTHPYRAGLDGRPLKERELSRQDLDTFGAGPDLVTMAMWDADSLDAAARGPDGGLRHPAAVVVR